MQIMQILRLPRGNIELENTDHEYIFSWKI